MRPARLWVRGAVRRPGRGLLVVGGLAAMSLTTVGALVAADSLETLFVADARAQWPDVDVAVTRPGEPVFGQGAASFVARGGTRTARAWTTRLILPVVATAYRDRRETAQLLGLSSQERQFGLPRARSGTTDLAELGPDEVVVNGRLAERLGVRVGDHIGLVIAVPELVRRDANFNETGRRRAFAALWDPRIAGIAADEKVADLARAPNLYAPLNQIQRVTRLDGQISALHAATRLPGGKAADRLVEDYEAEARRIGLVVTPVKEEALEIARDEGGLFRGILLTLALLVMAASVAVAINLLVALGEQRAREIAVLRAGGARRRVVERLLTAEGAVYAAAAAVVGAAVGPLLADRLAQRLADHFASINIGRGHEQVALALDARPVTIVVGAVVVFVVAVLAARAAARRVAYIDIDATLRGQPVGAVPVLSPRRPFIFAAAGLLVAGMGLTASDGGDFLRFAGITLLLSAWWLRARRRTANRARLDRNVAIAGIVWCVVAPALLGDFSRGVQSGFGLLAVAGALAVGFASIVCTDRLRQIMRVLRLYVRSARTQAALRTAASYAATNRNRSGTIMAAVGIVAFMIAALAVLGSTTDIPADRQSGGFDVIATSVATVPVDVVQSIGQEARVVALDYATLPERAFSVAFDDGGGRGSVPYPVRLVGLDASLGPAQRFELAASLPRYGTAEQAFRAVLADEDKCVIDRYARPEGAEPGDTVTITTGFAPYECELIAVLDTFVLTSAFVHPDAFDELAGTSGPTLLLASAPSWMSPSDYAKSIEDVGNQRGITADTIQEAAADVVRINRTFTDVFSVLLQLGLAVALVAVGALLGRAARERRAELGVLRAIGFRRRTVALTLAAEPLLTGTLGLAIGIGVGIAVLRLLFAVGFNDLAFSLSWTQIGGTAAGVEILLALVCGIPALRASRGDPAEALRDLG
jgi:putative ABC transport system permease protein